LARLDSRYPGRLRELRNGPACIAWKGGPLEAERTVAIVGARHAADEAVELAAETARVLAESGVVVVSGGALGIDAAAHRGALAAGGRTWAVAGTGPDHCFPGCHADLFETIARGPGAMIWPFGPGCRRAFLARNRVLVALADAVVVVQAGARSGALHAASCARELGKALWVVPAAPWMRNFSGSLKLLASGACVLTSVDPLLGSLGISRAGSIASNGSASPENSGTFSSSESSVLQVISNTALHVDAISAKANQPAQAVAAALLTLALENVVVEGPPGYFRRRYVSIR
jgi:DNA processing protein